MGLSPGWGGGSRLVKLVGRQKALEILLQCKRMNLTESLKCGLANDELHVPESKVCMLDVL
jgi:ethylmalonyl-CoA/methylmalonyl-CoA decarboxylase